MLFQKRSLVYLFPVDGLYLAIHVPQNDDVEWSEQGLRSLTAAFALSIPELDVAMVTLHWLPGRDRVEITLANTGTAEAFSRLQRRARQENAFQSFRRAGIKTVRAALQQDGKVECACAVIEYDSGADLIECNEVLTWSGVQQRAMCPGLLNFCSM